jgi:hypothetical protein
MAHCSGADFGMSGRHRHSSEPMMIDGGSQNGDVAEQAKRGETWQNVKEAKERN